MGLASCEDGRHIVLALILVFYSNLGDASSIVNMRRISHPAVQQTLAGKAVLPCVFTLQTNSSSEPPHLLWTRTRLPAGGQGAPQEETVLSARGDVIKLNKAFSGRVRLPGYTASPLNATMEISSLRTNDSGTYHCQIVMGNDYERDTVPLVVSGVVFHYQVPSDRYALSFIDAQRACQENSAEIATAAQLWAAYYDGFASCAAGWLEDQTVRYSVQVPDLGCYGHKEYSAGVRNYGKRDPKELFDVYCFAKELDGEVFHSSVPGRLSLSSASDRCVSLGGQLATVGQLYLAWKAGLDSCAPGWMADGSVRYPVTWPRPDCGGSQPGVRTITPNTTTDNSTALYDAYCYRGNVKSTDSVSQIYSSLWKPWSYLTGSSDADSTETDSSEPTAQPSSITKGFLDGGDGSPANWTGLVDIEEEATSNTTDPSADPWSPESSASYVTLQLIPGHSSLDWGEPLEPGPDSKDFLRPPVQPTSAEKKVISKIFSSVWKPWNYLAGTGDEEVTQAPTEKEEEIKIVTKKVEQEPNPTPAASPGFFSWGSSWFNTPWRENTTPAGEDSPTRLTSTFPTSSIAMTTESIQSKENSESHTFTVSSSTPEISSSSGDSWVRVDPDTTTTTTTTTTSQPSDKKAETVTFRAGGRGGRGRGKKNRAEDKSRGEEKGKGDDEGSGEITGAEAKGEIQVSRRPVGSNRTRERSRERSRERGHRKGQTTTSSTTTTTTSTTASPLETSVKTTTESDSTDFSTDQSFSTYPSETPSPSNSDVSHPSASSSTQASPTTTESIKESSSETASSQSITESQSFSLTTSVSSSTSTDFSSPMSSTDPSLSPTPSSSSPTLSSSSPTPASSSPTPSSSSPTLSSSSPTPLSPSATPASSSATPSSASYQSLPPMVGSGDPSPSPYLINEDISSNPPTVLPWLPVKKVDQNSSVEYHTLLSLPAEEEDLAWAHTVGSGALSPGNTEEETTNGANTSAVTVQPTDVDDCQSEPCENGGTCIDKIDSFLCLCLPSYGGDTCEKDIEGCEHGWWKFHGHCYRYFSHRHTWEDAEKDCREHSAHLSSVVSTSEQGFINGLGHDNAWIGLNDRTVEEDFQWTDGNDLVFENWRESQPDNFFAGGEDCVVTIAHEDGKWNDVPCNYNLPYICKKGTVLCGTPPMVENAHLVGRRRSHYDIHSVVRYQCSEGFFQRHIPTTRCRADGTWERPRIICKKSRRSHRYRRHHHNQRRERHIHRRHGGEGHRAREEAHSYY
uniref:Neurocan core protein-like n=1 Tax=Cynoglossus semilaevis TaxID=244447 RepID=A0A3P8WER1_CYNSE